MLKKTKEKIVAVVLLVGGLGLCIGGIFMPPLLVLGGGLLAGALAVISNILQDKDRITVNNNYITPPIDKQKESSSSKLTELENPKPSQKLKSFFGFKNKKFMQHHEEIERLLSETPVLDDHKYEQESNKIQLPADVLAELNKLNDAINKIDMDLIAKLARQFNENSSVHEEKNRGESP